MSSTTGSVHGTQEKMATAHLEHTPTHQGAIKVHHADGFIDYVDNHAVGGDIEGMPKGYYRSLSFIMTFLAICFGSICAYLGWVLPANTLALINADIGPSDNLNWTATTWTLGSAIGFLLVGRLSDIFGRKWMVVGCQILGTVGMIVGGTAHSINTLVGANLLNGIAAAGQLSFGFTVGELVSNKMRGPAITLVFVSSLPFAVFGPSIARAFILHTAQGWRWSYYLGIIVSGLSLILYVIFYHPPTYAQLHVGGKTKWQQFKELDFIGIILFCGGTVVFLIGLSWGGQAYPWKSAHVIATLIIGGLTLIAFGIYEAYFCKVQALMPTRMFKNVGFVAIVVIAAIGAMVYYSLTILWPLIMSTVYGQDVVQTGLSSSLVGGGVLLGQICGGLAISYMPKVKWQAVIMAALGASFIASLASMEIGNYAKTIVLALLGLIAIGWIDNISFPGVTLLWGAHDIGAATGILGSLRALAGAVAQALYVTIFSNKLTKYLPEYVAPAATGAGLPASSLPALFAGITTGNFSAVPGFNEQIGTVVAAQVKHAYLDSFKIVFYATIPFGVLLVIAACFVPNMDKYLVSDVARRLQNVKSNQEVAPNKETV